MEKVEWRNGAYLAHLALVLPTARQETALPVTESSSYLEVATWLESISRTLANLQVGDIQLIGSRRDYNGLLVSVVRFSAYRDGAGLIETVAAASELERELSTMTRTTSGPSLLS